MNIKSILAIIGGICLATTLLMQIGSYYYINNTKRKARLVELAYGLNNKWANGARISFIDTGFLFGIISSLALVFQLRRKLGKKIVKQDLFPYLHLNNNYINFWQEFRGFSIWSICSLVIALIFLVCTGTGYAIDKGFFNQLC